MTLGQINILRSNDFVKSFQINCLTLIGDAYLNLMQTRKITIDFEEEQVSANIFKYIDENPKAAGLNINISDECRQYCQKIIDGKKTAKSASRIDLKFSTNWTKKCERVRFYVEAKNLIEKNCQRSNSKQPVNANRCHNRYIDTGIDMFVKGTYPMDGCVLGYILEGNPDIIAGKINALLCSRNRVNEQLTAFGSCIDNLVDCYQSSHSDNLHLNHYWLDFNSQINS